MKALGKGSIASIVRTGLMVAWWILWAAAGVVAAVSVTYGVVLALAANGIIDPSELESGNGFTLGNFHIAFDQPGDGAGPSQFPRCSFSRWRLRARSSSFGGFANSSRLSRQASHFDAKTRRTFE